MNFFEKHPILSALVVPIVASIALVFFNVYHEGQSQHALGGTASNPAVAAVFETSLAAPMGSGDTTFTLASVQVDAAGDTLANGVTYPFTVDQGTNVQEFITATCVSTACTVVQRGLSPLTGTTSVAALKFAHRRGADVKITDWPSLGIVNNQINGLESIPNAIYYNYNFSSAFWASAASNTIATLGIVNDTAASGCGLGNATAKGCVQLATALQAASSTVTGSTGANDVLWSKYATDTPQNCSTPGNGGCVVMSLLNGKLAQAWYDLTQAFTFSGGLTSSATTTLAGSNVFSNAVKLNGVPYAFPASQGATSTFLRNDGTGNLSSVLISGLIATSTAGTNIVSSAASTTIFSATVSPNALIGGAISITFHLTQFALLSSDKLFLCVLYGASPACFSLNNGTGGSLSVTAGSYTVTMYGGSASNAETVVQTLQTQAAGVATTQAGASVINSTAIATDSTASQTLTVVARLSANSASDIFNVQDYLATLSR